MCQLDALQNCLHLTALRKALASLPKTLDETYARILHNILDEYSGHAIRILQFLSFSMRPLKLGEVAEIIAINLHGDPWFDHDARLPEPRDILTICAGLVVEEEGEADNDASDSEDRDEDDGVDSKDDSDSGDSDENDSVNSEDDSDEECNEYYVKRGEEHDEHPDEDREVEFDGVRENSGRYGNDDNDEENGEDINEDSEEDSANDENGKSTDSVGDERSKRSEHEDLSEVDENDVSTNVSFTEYDFKNRNIVRLAHFSVKEYLLSERIRDKTSSSYAKVASKYAIQELSAHESIAAHCLAHLHQFEKYGEVERSDLVDEYRYFIKGYHFSNYAATQWIEHLKMLGKDLQTTRKLILSLFFTHKKALEKFNSMNSIYHPKPDVLYAASRRGATELIRLLLENGADANAQGRYDFPLHVASRHGHIETVQLLLENGADVNAETGHSGTALTAASRGGHFEIVQLLLNNGAEFKATSEIAGTALHAASSRGHVKIVQLLLSKGADANVLDAISEIPLCAASRNGNIEIVQLLLNNGADINARGGIGCTALHAAAYQGHTKLTELLLSKQADVSISGRFTDYLFEDSDGTALHTASLQGFEAIVELLLEYGADPYAVGIFNGKEMTALDIAVARGIKGMYYHIRASPGKYVKVEQLLKSAQDSRRNANLSLSSL